MKYDVYFHKDFDGHASAAVMLAFLRSRGDDIEHYVPLKFDIMPQWLDEKFFDKHKLFESSGKRNPAIVVDFPYHPGAKFWFDHHLKPFRKPAWEKKFKPDRFRRYDDGYASACHLVCDSLKEGFGWKPPAYLKELVKWLDIIDGARYASAKQTIAMKEPAIQLNNFIEEHTGGIDTIIWTIRALAEKPIVAITREPGVRKDIAKLRANTKEALAFYKKNLKIVQGIMVIDLSKYPFAELGHYAPYFLHPELLYAIRYYPFRDRPSYFHVNVAANPWRVGENKKNIGELMKRHGGGGHLAVGGVEIEGREKVQSAIRDFIRFLNEP